MPAFVGSGGLRFCEPSTKIATVCRRTAAGRRRSVVRAVAAEPTKISEYDSLAEMTTIVEDTGEINFIAEHKPFAATTNPSLVAKAASMPEYDSLVAEAVEYGKAAKGDTLLNTRMKLFTLFGAKILEIVPGDVSTEVDARCSFDAETQVERGLKLIKMYEEVGVEKERVLIKLASTWEGIQACRELEKQGIRTNMTLLFNLHQAAAAAEAGAYLISPFVGRILDWHKKKDGVDGYPADEDPGVVSVRAIFDYYKVYGYDTVIMGASFRNKEEILALAGCDRLTISPKFINDLKASCAPVERKLIVPDADSYSVPKLSVDEKSFRFGLNQDAMATEKLAEGIRGFAADLEKLDAQLAKLL